MRDLKLAFRRLSRSPGFTLAAILSLALGIGANVTLFSLVNSIFFKGLPVERPDELVFLNRNTGPSNIPTNSYLDYRDVRDRNDVLTGLIAYRFTPISFSRGGQNQRLWAYLATGNYFEVLGVRPAAGRFFGPEDDTKPGAHPLAVLSYDCWQTRFGGDPGAIGQTVKLNQREYTVIGVAPRGFRGTELFFAPDLWVPMMMATHLESYSNWLHTRNDQNIWVLGRMKPGLTRQRVQAGLDAVAAQLAAEHPRLNEGLRFELTPPGLAGSMLRKGTIAFLAALSALTGMVLVIACTNLANLMLARGTDQRKETAVRLALGAGRSHLVRQFLTESLVLSVMGGALGFLITVWTVSALSRWRAPMDFTFQVNLEVDGTVALFTFAASLSATLLFGLAPALQSTRPDLVPALKNDTALARLRRFELRDLLIGAQVAISILLLVASTLAVHSLRRSLELRPGFHPDGAATAGVHLALEGYDTERGKAFQKRAIQMLESEPGIQSVAWTNGIPLTFNVSGSNPVAEGIPEPKPADAIFTWYYQVSPHYFRTMGTRLLAGREIEWQDTPDRPLVAVVNLAFAEKVFPGQDPLGRRFRMGSDAELYQVVGVVEDGKYLSLTDHNQPAIFLSALQRYSDYTVIVARSPLAPQQTAALLRRKLLELDPAIVLFDVQPLRDVLALPTFPARLAAGALGGFGILSIILAATGLYGVMAYAVVRRTREIGIRMALGAAPRQVLATLMSRMSWVLAAGVMLGVTAAAAAANFLAPLLYGVDPRDWQAYVSAVVLIGLIALAAAWVPARRAIALDPAKALREQ